MIFDTLSALEQYRGICTGLDKLIEFVLTHDLNALHDGRNEIDGDHVWMNRNVARLGENNGVFERHLEHLDLQIALEPGEIITVRPVDELDWKIDAETCFATGEPGIPLPMRPGMFAVFFPGDAHNCGISENGETSCRKLVGKARV